MIRDWQGRRSCQKRELQSLVGKLQHACKVVKPGRSFLMCIVADCLTELINNACFLLCNTHVILLMIGCCNPSRRTWTVRELYLQKSSLLHGPYEPGNRKRSLAYLSFIDNDEQN